MRINSSLSSAVDDVLGFDFPLGPESTLRILGLDEDFLLAFFLITGSISMDGESLIIHRLKPLEQREYSLEVTRNGAGVRPLPHSG